MWKLTILPIVILLAGCDSTWTEAGKGVRSESCGVDSAGPIVINAVACDGSTASGNSNGELAANGSLFSGEQVVRSRIVMTLESESGWDLTSFETLDLYLFLGSADGGVAGVISSSLGHRQQGLAAVTGHVEGTSVQLDGGTVSANGVHLAWSAFDLVMSDSDDDGVLDTGTGTASGELDYAVTDMVFWARYSATLVARLDTNGPLGSIASTRSRPAGTLFVTDGIQVVFDEPVYWSDVQSMLQIIADGTLLDGTIEPGNLTHGLLTNLTFRTQEFLPFGVHVTLSPGLLTDPAGNFAAFDGEPLRTPDDPGSLIGNPSFESGLSNWTLAGSVETTSTVNLHVA